MALGKTRFTPFAKRPMMLLRALALLDLSHIVSHGLLASDVMVYTSEAAKNWQVQH